MTPLERAARALYRLHDGPSKDLLDRLKAEGRADDLAEELAEEDQVWPHYVEDARAVLTAIREPSEGMKNDGWNAGWINTEDFDLTEAWQAMIDAAMAEGE